MSRRYLANKAKNKINRRRSADSAQRGSFHYTRGIHWYRLLTLLGCIYNLTGLPKDIYTSSIKGRPAFVKSDFLDTGDKYEGLASERDIDKHRVGRKQLAPAFNPRALKQYQPAIHEHVDEFIQKLEGLPVTEGGLEISPVRSLPYLLPLLQIY